MELWIRSQDKTKLVKADNISYLDVSDDYEKEVHSLWNDCKGVLGIYKTKERALEVLDEIQYLLRGHVYESHINKFDIYNGDDIKVYEMPKE